MGNIPSWYQQSYSPGSLRLQQQQQQQQQGDDQPKINPSFSPGQPSAPRRLSLYSSRAGAPFQRIKSRLSLQQSPSTSVVWVLFSFKSNCFCSFFSKLPVRYCLALRNKNCTALINYVDGHGTKQKQKKKEKKMTDWSLLMSLLCCWKRWRKTKRKK